MLAATTGELSFGYLNDKSEVKPGPGTTDRHPLPVIADAHHR